MEKQPLTEVINNLTEDEAMETQMIGLYLTLLEVGIEKCLPEEHRTIFRQKLEKIYTESKMHKEIVQQLLKKYHA